MRYCTCIMVIFLMTCFVQAAGKEPKEEPKEGSPIFVAVPGDEVPAPSFDRIDYSRPKDYLFLNDHMGSRERILEAAREIEGTLKGAVAPEKKLVAINRFLESKVSYKEDYYNEWRKFDEMLDDGAYGGCANYSVLFGSLTRASGIPTVWVKTLDVDWIRLFRTKGTEGNWSGHVFLEVFIHDRWMLLDETQLVLYEDYDPKMRILPGNRYAYDKGGDPYELVLSARWELWKKQVRAYFSNFDLSKLPVGKGTNLLHNVVEKKSEQRQEVKRLTK